MMKKTVLTAHLISWRRKFYKDHSVGGRSVRKHPASMLHGDTKRQAQGLGDMPSFFAPWTHSSPCRFAAALSCSLSVQIHCHTVVLKSPLLFLCTPEVRASRFGGRAYRPRKTHKCATAGISDLRIRTFRSTRNTRQLRILSGSCQCWGC